jgi:hypothetical protein
MNPVIIRDCIIMVGCAMIGFFPFNKKCVRAGWAKLVFVIIAVVGVSGEVVQLAIDSAWFTLGATAGRILQDYLYMVNGVILGLVISLILSGQLAGKKHPPSNVP